MTSCPPSAGLSLSYPPYAAKLRAVSRFKPGRYRSHLAQGRQRRPSLAFTLIELLVVVAVIAILAGITLAALGGAQKRSARDRTKGEISAIANALERYRSQHGGYPEPASGNALPMDKIGDFLDALPGAGSNTTILDPFGQPYVYVLPGQKNRASFDLYSPGDNPNATNSRIGNW